MLRQMGVVACWAALVLVRSAAAAPGDGNASARYGATPAWRTVSTPGCREMGMAPAPYGGDWERRCGGVPGRGIKPALEGVWQPTVAVCEDARACLRGWQCPLGDGLLNSRKAAADCLPKDAELIPLLVTGLPGAGTNTMTAYLAGAGGLGAAAAHEVFARDAVVSWYHAFNDWFIGMAYPGNRLPILHPLTPRFGVVVHLVRCPLRTIHGISARLAPGSAELIARATTGRPAPFAAAAAGPAARPKPPLFCAPYSSITGDGRKWAQEVVMDGGPFRRGANDTIARNSFVYLTFAEHVDSYADARVRLEAVTAATLRAIGELAGIPALARVRGVATGQDALETKRLNARRNYLPGGLTFGSIERALASSSYFDAAAPPCDDPTACRSPRQIADHLRALGRRHGYCEDCTLDRQVPHFANLGPRPPERGASLNTGTVGASPSQERGGRRRRRLAGAGPPLSRRPP